MASGIAKFKVFIFFLHCMGISLVKLRLQNYVILINFLQIFMRLLSSIRTYNKEIFEAVKQTLGS